MPRPFAVIGITLYITLAMLSYLNDSSAVFAAIIAGICLIPLFCIKNCRKQVVLPAACLTIIAGCIMFVAFDEFNYKPAIALAGEKIGIAGKIVDLPTKDNGRFYYVVKTSTLNNEPLQVKLRLSCSTPLEAEPFDVVQTEAKVYILGEENEDSLQYYKTIGIYLGAYSSSDIFVISTKDKPVMYHVLALKQRLLNNINELLPNESGGLIVALLLGDKSFMSDKTLSDFRDIGISHVVAISGLNLSIFLLIFLDIFERLKLNKRFVYILSLVFILLVMALAGFSASVLRAGIMLIVLLLGKLINKDDDAINSIGLSILLISLFNPFGAGYVGLQLSFFATLGIITIQKRLNKPFDNIADKITFQTFRRFIKFVFETVTVTVSAFVFTLPTIILTFGKVAIISVLSNLLLVYSSTLSMIFGGFAALSMEFKIVSFLSNPLAIIAGLLAKYIIVISDLLAKIPLASVSATDIYIKVWLSGSFLLLAAAVYIYKKNGKAYMKMTSALCISALIIAILSFNIFNNKITKITVAAVGNASAIIISKGGRAVLIGCGGDDFAVKKINDSLNKNNLKSLDLLLIPRAALTESQAALNIINDYNVKKIIAPELNYDLAFISRYKNFELVQRKRFVLWQDAMLDYCYTEDLSCAYADLEGTTVLFIFYPGCNVGKIPKRWKSADLLICRAKVPQEINSLDFGTVVISADESIGINEVNKIISSGGYAVTTAVNSNLEIKSSGNSIYSVGREN